MRCFEETWQTSNRAFKRGLNTKIHLISCSSKFALTFRLSPGNNHDAPEGRKLIETITSDGKHYLIMDRAYEGYETRSLAEN